MFGRIKEYAFSRRLFLDFDMRRCPRVRPLWAVCRIIGAHPKTIRFDRTRRGWHVVIELSEWFSPLEVVAMQAVLGSDARREALNLMRVLSEYGRLGEKRWNILYSRKLK